MKKILLNKDFNFYYFPKLHHKLYLTATFGIMALYLPKNYFFKNSKNKLSLLFINKFWFLNFFKHFKQFYTFLSNLYFVRLKIRGLGFRIKSFGSSVIIRFFFAYVNFIYFYVPKMILLWHRGRRLFLVSNNLSKLNLIFKHLLLLKKLDPYKIKGLLRRPYSLIFLRKKEKAMKGRFY